MLTLHSQELGDTSHELCVIINNNNNIIDMVIFFFSVRRYLLNGFISSGINYQVFWLCNILKL